MRVALRDVEGSDLQSFFDFQCDEEANVMAAFVGKDPQDRSAFDERWSRILANEAIVKQTVLVGDAVVGHVSAYQSDDLDAPEVTYWIGREFWGSGVATRALRLFLATMTRRPLYGRCAETNPASLRVLQKCGFVVVREDVEYANAHGKDVREFVLRLDA